MKKLFVSAVAAVALAALALPASALEHQFGGYWRTRAYTQGDYAANEAMDISEVDARTRLYYTAKFSDNLKLVNKFEMDVTWGASKLGKIGADGKDFEIKNTYLDATFGDWNAKVGTQGGTIARGFLFDDDFSGAVLTYKAAGFSVPVMWIKHTEGGIGKDANDQDIDYLVVNPTVNVSEQLAVNPVFMVVNSKDARAIDPTYEEMNVYYLGLNADMDFGMGNAWFTGIYQLGSIDPAGGGKSMDVNAYLAALGADVNMGAFGVHGQMFYASGPDLSGTGTDMEAFTGPTGQSYYWSEIMGLGMFDNYASSGSPGDAISNITAVNIGASMSPMEKLTVTADVWYAMLNEVAAGADDELGTEFDLAANYKLMDNLTLDVVGAYLVAGDATGKDDPWLVGTQLSLKF